MKHETKEFLKLIVGKNVKEAEKMLPNVYKVIDKAAKRGIIKKNNAARKKSRLTKQIVNLKQK